MILPVYVYGHPLLRKKSENISPEYPNLEGLIANMFDTMYHTGGVGLAAPQIGKSIRLFIVDGKAYEKEEPALADFKKIFINAEILNESGEEWSFNEGCLSVPKIREDIRRRENIRLKYMNEKFESFEEDFSGIAARIIQHEYDHLEGKLFIDHVSSLKKALLKRRLTDISKGRSNADYRIVVPEKRKSK